MERVSDTKKFKCNPRNLEFIIKNNIHINSSSGFLEEKIKKFNYKGFF